MATFMIYFTSGREETIEAVSHHDAEIVAAQRGKKYGTFVDSVAYCDYTTLMFKD